ncbi:glycogen debranching enzyme N-terminal domain-containing protein [Actinoplanes cyaneus]|uniref:glycogen debranching enzyme N-terminal domain-containing protein n=1 Tax=Actinoplanes cyaneus TaxID=52696 RepID=UPI001944DD3D|nr:glycogen debranching enzyme N-terminal domain-containing protein [Actinoplanes cyaneus]MCW2139462.1 Glycogen debranching enzyme (alpha-1,6-glucosidase) [Actinoplanes cyaneus]
MKTEHRGDVPRIDPLILGPQICGVPSRDAGAGREWLLTDGLGGWASGTVSGLRTRREHALLAVAGPGRTPHVALAALDLTVTLHTGTKVPLYTHAWESGSLDPQGHRLLETFTLDSGLPRWRWRIGDVVIERELALGAGTSTLAVVHRVLSAPGPVGLTVAAMCTWREATGTRRADGPGLRIERVADGVVVEGAYRLTGPGWQPAGQWHLGARAGEQVEDLWHAGSFSTQAGPGDTCEISAWTGDLAQRPPAPPVVLAAARERAHRLVTAAKAEGYAATLALAADTFVIQGPDGPALADGYPWTGRAAPVAAYEGLLLDTGRADEGRELLRALAERPATDAGGPLWLVHAVDRHVTRTGDSDLARDLAVPLSRLLRRSLDDSRPLSMDPADGLLTLSAADCPGSGRTGKLVEVNALWVNALAALGDLLAEGGKDDAEARERHARARESFLRRFPAPEGWLHDVVEGPAAPYPLGAGTQHDDPTLRPCQLLAWSLPHGPMRGAAGTAVRACGQALLTPLGLRTLAPDEYGYDGANPDQGLVRPWLIGAYADACAATGHPVDGLLDGLAAHLAEWGVGSVGEAAHGDAPHPAIGRPFDALAVAETLRVQTRYAP